MNAHEYLKKMYDVHNLLLDYIDEEVNEQEKLNNFLKLFNSHKIVEDKHLITSTIHLLSSIINYHHRATNFFNKIFNIILFLKNEFPQNYSDFEIFEFFKRNKRVILFLIKEKIINLKFLQYIDSGFDEECDFQALREITALYKSVECKNSEIVKLLLEHKDINVNNKSSIKFHNYYYDDEEPEDSYYMEDTALFHAIFMKNVDAVELLLNCDKIDVSIKKIIKYSTEHFVEKTVLHDAVKMKVPEIVKLLLEHKNIDVNAKLLQPVTKYDDDL